MATTATATATSTIYLQASNPFAGWSVEKVSAMFSGPGVAYNTYGTVIKANAVNGDILGECLNEGASGVNNLLYDLQITNSLHVRVLSRVIFGFCAQP
jgi:hypothetical protein